MGGSSALKHAVNDLNLFQNIEKMPEVEAELADGTVITSQHRVKGLINVRNWSILLGDLHCIHTLSLNLMLCTLLDDPGICNLIGRGTCTIIYKKDCILPL